MLHLNIMLQCYRKCITCNMSEVRRMFIESSKASTGKYHIFRFYYINITCCIFNDKSITLVSLFITNHIKHFNMFTYSNIIPFQCIFKKSACNLFACYILMIQYSWSSMASFSRKCKFVTIMFKINTIIYKFLRYLLR